MSVSEPLAVSEFLEILRPEEAAAYLRVPEDALLKLAGEGNIPARKIGDEWRFLKRALNDWLRWGGRQNGGPLSPDWLLESRFAEELLAVLEQRLLHKLEAFPKPGSKEAVLKHFGIFRDDEDMGEQLAHLRAQREAP